MIDALVQRQIISQVLYVMGISYLWSELNMKNVSS